MAIRATYSQGVLRLIDPLDLPENTEVELLLIAPKQAGVMSDRERGDAILVAAGLTRQRLVSEQRAAPTPVELSATARSLPSGTPLSELVREDREERC
jgi:predicted DNA-binding antitoxin AbrB/MazE fold protein